MTTTTTTTAATTTAAATATSARLHVSEIKAKNAKEIYRKMITQGLFDKLRMLSSFDRQSFFRGASMYGHFEKQF